MIPEFAMVLMPFAAIIIAAAAQIISCRMTGGRNIVRSILVGLACGILVVLLGANGRLSLPVPLTDRLALVMIDLLTYLALFYCFLFFILVCETGLRTRIMKELADSQDGLLLEEILRRYSARHMIALRLDRLIGSGQIACVDGKLRISGRAVPAMARFIEVARLLILGKRVGFQNAAVSSPDSQRQ